MKSAAIRDPLGDHLLTLQNAAMFLIDYQPSLFAAVRRMNRHSLLENIVSTCQDREGLRRSDRLLDDRSNLDALTTRASRIAWRKVVDELPAEAEPDEPASGRRDPQSSNERREQT